MFVCLHGKTHYLPRQQSLRIEIQELLLTLRTTINNYNFYAQGKLLESFDQLTPLTTIHAIIPLKGGKGGYGAKLKTQGGKKIKPNDNMFSRDMSGQRLVYANMEKQFREFVVAKHQEDKRVAHQREQFKVMQNTLKEGQSFMKLDKTYKKDIQETEKNLIDSIRIGKQRAIQRLRKQEEKKDQIVKNEQQKDNELAIEQNKSADQSLKRNRPEQAEEDNVGQILRKKIKEQSKVIVKQKIQVKTVVQKAVFSSAQQRFKNLFKK